MKVGNLTSDDVKQNYFSGFEEIESNFIQFPKQWTNIMASINNLAELKIVEYVIRHTWGYNGIENRVKKITVDEFVNGRKDRMRNRIDNGTGLSESSVKVGIKKAVEHGFLKIEIDDRDKARVKRYFTLYTQVQRKKDLLAPFILQLILIFSFLRKNINTWIENEEVILGGQNLTPRELESNPRSGIEIYNKNLNSNYSNVNKLEYKIEKNKKEYIKFQAPSIQVIHQRSRTNLTSLADILNKSYTVPVTGKKCEGNENKIYETVYVKKENTYSNFQKASPALTGFTKQISMEFGDMNHIASNIQQMKNILALVKSRGVSEESFLDFAFGIKGLVRENQYTIQGSKIGYYFKVLRTNLKIN